MNANPVYGERIVKPKRLFKGEIVTDARKIAEKIADSIRLWTISDGNIKTLVDRIESALIEEYKRGYDDGHL